MALMTKAQVRTAVAQAIDDPSNKRWTAANLDILISLVQDTVWQAINDTFEFFLSQTDTVTITAGSAALSSLSKRFYRIQKVSSTGGVGVQPKLFGESLPQESYHLLGGGVVFENSILTSANISYSYIPTKFNDLATDGTALAEWPEGHEAALIYLSAAWALAKGDAEDTRQNARLADMALEAMLTHIARRYPIGSSAMVQQVKNAVLMTSVEGGR